MGERYNQAGSNDTAKFRILSKTAMDHTRLAKLLLFKRLATYQSLNNAIYNYVCNCEAFISKFCFHDSRPASGFLAVKAVRDDVKEIEAQTRKALHTVRELEVDAKSKRRTWKVRRCSALTSKRKETIPINFSRISWRPRGVDTVTKWDKLQTGVFESRWQPQKRDIKETRKRVGEVPIRMKKLVKWLRLRSLWWKNFNLLWQQNETMNEISWPSDKKM